MAPVAVCRVALRGRSVGGARDAAVLAQANDLDARQTLFAFWSRIARTVAVLFAVLVAVPFVFGSLRASGGGARTTVGLLIGIGFFLLQRMLESGAVVFDLDPVLLAWVPTALLATAALALIARTR